MQPERFEKFQRAIHAMHGCEVSAHEESVPVTEEWQGAVVWTGIVEVFSIVRHPMATAAYAWDYEEAGEWRCVSLLQLPPITTPQRAVQAAVAREVERQRGR